MKIACRRQFFQYKEINCYIINQMHVKVAKL